jgi:hypothetical protein
MKKVYIFLSLLLAALCSEKSFSQCSVTMAFTNGSNGTVNFTSSVTGTGPFNYTWSFGDSSFAYTANPSHNYWYNNTYMVCVNIVDSLTSCSDSACAPVTVTNSTQVATCPGNAAFTVSPNGSQTTFTNTAGSWMVVDLGDGSSSYGTSFNHQYHLNGTYQVTAIAYSYFGSNFLPCDTSLQTITVNNVPCQAAFYAFADTTNGGYLYLQNQSMGDANNTWYINGAVVASNVDSFISNMAPGVYTICLAITGPNGCSDSTCQNVTFTYTVPCADITFAYAPLSGCDTYQFTVNNAGAPLTSIGWYLNSVWVSSLSTLPLTLDFTSAQNNVYSQSVAVTAQRNGCTVTQNFGFYNPSAFYIWLDTITTGGNIWYAVPQNPAGVTSELWDFGDGTTSTLTYPTHSYATAGYYTVCHTVTINGTCNYTYCQNQYFYRGASSQGISYFVVLSPTGITQHAVPGETKVYPNPSSSFVIFDLGKASTAYLTLTIYNSQGAVVKTATLKNGVRTFSLDIAFLRSGMYDYKISGAPNAEAQGKICVAK